jgi:hypothetical protein
MAKMKTKFQLLCGMGRILWNGPKNRKKMCGLVLWMERILNGRCESLGVGRRGDDGRKGFAKRRLSGRDVTGGDS